MTIIDMKKQQTATVLSLSNLQKKYTDRLMDVGIYESAEVTLLNILAMGRLYLLEVDDIESCIRKEDAEMIEVSP